jgi:hypothetical protein
MKRFRVLSLLFTFCFIFSIFAHSRSLISIAVGATTVFREEFNDPSLPANWYVNSMNGAYSIGNGTLTLRSMDYSPWASISIQRNCESYRDGFTLRTRVRNNGGFGVYFALFVSNQTFVVSTNGQENAKCTRNTMALCHDYDAFRICRGISPTAIHWSGVNIADPGTIGNWYVLELQVNKSPYQVTANVYDDNDVLVGSDSITDMVLPYSEINMCGVAAWRGASSTDALTKYDVDWISFTPSVSFPDSLAEGLVAYYPFDTGADNVAYDYSGNGNEGMIEGASWTSGLFGDALSFDGNDYVSCGILGDFGSASLKGVTSYTFWFKTSQIVHSCVLGTANSPYPSMILVIHFNTPETDKIRLYLRDNTQKRLSADLSDPFDFTGTGWHHFAVIVDTAMNNVTVYIDGTPRPITYRYRESPESFTNFQYPFYVGALNWMGSIVYDSIIQPQPMVPFEGVLDDVRIYARALTESEMRILSSKEPPFVLRAHVSKNFEEIAANITVVDENMTVIGTIVDSSSYSWLVDSGRYTVQASIARNDVIYTSEPIGVEVSGYVDVAINFPFSNLTISCIDTENQPLGNCTTVFTRGSEHWIQSTDSSGFATIEAYYGNWTVAAWWMGVLVGEAHLVVNQSQTALSLQCFVGDLTVLVTGPLGNPVEAEVTVSNDAYNVTLCHYHHAKESNLTFTQIPLLEYNLILTGDFDTQYYQVSVDQIREIRIETLPFSEKILFIVLGLVIGLVITVLGRRVLAQRELRWR